MRSTKWDRFHRNLKLSIEQVRSWLSCSDSYGSNFGEKYFLIKYMLFDSVFDADSEYHVCFA